MPGIYQDIIEMSIGNNIEREQPIIFNEVYFGKTKELLEAEKIINKIRTEYRYNEDKVNMSKEIMQFNRLMEKAFKLECFSLVVNYSGLYNACTIPMGIMIDAPNANNIASDKISGFNYNYCKGSSIIVYINSGLLFDERFTDGEIMGIIMHEIGHNFQSAISPTSRGFSYIQRSIMLFTLPLQYLYNPSHALQLTTGTRKWYLDILNKLKNDNNQLLQFVYTYKYIFSKIMGFVLSPIHLLQNLKKMVAIPIPIPSPDNIISAVFNLPKFTDEALADNFATIYGYGAECNSALDKMKHAAGGWKDEEAIRSIPFVSTYFDLVNLPTKMVINIIDCHPNEAFRNKHQIDLLKRELDKSEIDPKMKGKIRKDINDLEKTLKSATDMTDDAFVYTNMYAAFLLTLFNGDIKSFMASRNFDDFDIAYQNNLSAIKNNKR